MSIAEKFEVIADEVYEKGKKDEYDKFWDENQDFGNRTNYSNGFLGYAGWTKDNFYPKYDIKPVGDALQMLYAWEDDEKHKFDLAQRLEECDVILDTSKATRLDNAFAYSRFTRIPAIDLTSTTTNNAGLCAYGYRLITIDKIIVNENTKYSGLFTNDSSLKNIIFEGKIGQSNLNCRTCTSLTTASLLSILTALSKDQSIASGKSVTFSTVHQSVIEGDADCLEQLNLAVAAGWTIAYA